MQIACLLYDRFAALDIVGPHEVLNALPDTETVFVAERAGPVSNEDGSLTLLAQRSLEEVTAPEILIVPGGFGTRALLEHEPVLDWIRRVHEQTRWTTSVCTGALLLAAAGILDGKRATTFWGQRELLRSLGAEPVTDRVVEEGKVITAAGVSAGIDMALYLVQRIHGDEAAQAVQLGIEYDPQPPFDTGAPEKAPREIVELVAKQVGATVPG
jgi:putative intracellular protease/amidase